MVEMRRVPNNWFARILLRERYRAAAHSLLITAEIVDQAGEPDLLAPYPSPRSNLEALIAFS